MYGNMITLMMVMMMFDGGITNYAVSWDENCGVLANSSISFDVDWSFAPMDKLKSDGSLSCIISSCGYGKNTILDTERKLEYNHGSYAVPMVQVNVFVNLQSHQKHVLHWLLFVLGPLMAHNLMYVL